jgi:hypothetical protein
MPHLQLPCVMCFLSLLLLLLLLLLLTQLPLLLLLAVQVGAGAVGVLQVQHPAGGVCSLRHPPLALEPLSGVWNTGRTVHSALTTYHVLIFHRPLVAHSLPIRCPRQHPSYS